MTHIIDPNAPPAPSVRSQIAMQWKWSPEAVKAALQHAGVPPKLNMQAMLNAAFAIDGEPLTAMIFEILIGNRVRELDAAPYVLYVAEVGAVELNGQFLLHLFADRMDLLRGVRTSVPPRHRDFYPGVTR